MYTGSRLVELCSGSPEAFFNAIVPFGDLRALTKSKSEPYPKCKDERNDNQHRYLPELCEHDCRNCGDDAAPHERFERELFIGECFPGVCVIIWIDESVHE